MSKFFDFVEWPSEKLFHLMHTYAEKRSYQKDDEYRQYEDTVRKFSSGNSRVMASDEDPLLTIDNWFEMSEKVYEINPWLHIFHKGQLLFKKPRHWKSNLIAAWMRARKGYDRNSIWNFQYWHSKKMVQMLTELRDNKHTHPCDMTPEEWDEILNEIIAGFQATIDMEELIYVDRTRHDAEYEPLLAIFNHGMDLMKEHYFSLWD